MGNGFKRQFKVTKELTGQCLFRQYDDYAVGDIVIGTIVGSRVDKYKKHNLIIKVEDAQFKEEEAAKYNGKNLCLNSCGTLAKALKDAGMTDADGKIKDSHLGQMIQLEYQGKTQLGEKHTYSGNDCHVLKLDLVEEDDGTAQSGDVEL